MAARKRRVAFSGSRTFTDRRLVERAVSKVAADRDKLLVPCGEPGPGLWGGYQCTSGVDTFVHHWVVSHGYDHAVFNARWDSLGKKAGFVRNAEMIKQADMLIAFLADDPTPGTSHTIRLAQEKGIPIHLYHRGRWISVDMLTRPPQVTKLPTKYGVPWLDDWLASYYERMTAESRPSYRRIPMVMPKEEKPRRRRRVERRDMDKVVVG